MKLFITTIFLFALLPFSIYSQADVQLSQLDTALVVYKKAVNANDCATIAALTHPNVTQLSGGENYLIEACQEEHKMYEKIGLSFEALILSEYGDPIRSKDAWYVPIDYKVEYDQDGAIYTETNTLLAGSTDEGSTWYFLDLKKYDKASIRAFLPDYSEDLDYLFEK